VSDCGGRDRFPAEHAGDLGDAVIAGIEAAGLKANPG